MSSDENNRQKNFRLKRHIRQQEDDELPAQLQQEAIDAYMKLGIDEDSHWTRVIDRVTKVFAKGTKDIDSGFVILDSLLQTAPKTQTKEIEDELEVFTKQKVAETIINERMLFYIKSFMWYSNPTQWWNALKLLNNCLQYSSLAPFEQQKLVTSKLLDDILKLIIIEPKEENVRIISNAITWVGTLALESTYILKSIQNRFILK